jgi:hypothetical protein
MVGEPATKGPGPAVTAGLNAAACRPHAAALRRVGETLVHGRHHD